MNVIVPAGGGNIGSVCYAFERLKVPVKVSLNSTEISQADRIILPGVGAFDPGMLALERHNLVTQLRNTKQPILGICLGMQLLYQSSEEGQRPGLGLIDGRVKALGRTRSKLQMGWNNLRFVDQISPDEQCPDQHGADQHGDDSTGSTDYLALAKDLPPQPHCYFVHSYEAPLNAAVKATVDFEGDVPAVVHQDRVFGFQFHPERSGNVGDQLLRNFLFMTSRWCNYRARGHTPKMR